MRTLRALSALTIVALASTACKKKPAEEPTPDLRAQVAAFTAPIVAVDGLDPAKITLGARLYHDPNLSADGTIACASCHVIADGGDDGNVKSPGVGGALGGVNSPTTLNSHLSFVQFWDGRAASLEEQALGPIANPVEMASNIDSVVEYLRSEPSYVEAFDQLYDGEISADTVTKAIATFETSLTTPNSPFDQWLAGDDNALNEQQLQGLQTFVDTGCTSCHTGPALGGTMYQRMGLINPYFEGRELTPEDNGRFNVTGNEADRHMFKVPTLRNVALTAPYFHDGTAQTLEDAIRKMAHHQLNAELSDEEVANVSAFLNSLTGEIPAIDIAALNLPAPRTTPADNGDANADEAAPEADDAQE